MSVTFVHCGQTVGRMKLGMQVSALATLCLDGVIMAALRSRYGHYILALWFLLRSFFVA